MRRLKILTWHTHGNYLYYLSHLPHDFYVLSKPDRPPGYGGRCGTLLWGDNVIDLPAGEAASRAIDCVLFQDDAQYLEDQHHYLSPSQRRGPRLYLEHDTPRHHPTDMPHPVDDPAMLLVHVTHFNDLMWDARRTPTVVIEHGVPASTVRWHGTLPRGLVVANHLARRGRRLGADVFDQVRRAIPLDLVGMGAQDSGGLGEIAHADLAAFCSQYRFFFHPVRYTSLGLAVIEAMMIGMPVVALATTEMATVIRDGENGHAHTSVDNLVGAMRDLLDDPANAARLGQAGRTTALSRFGMARFIDDWNRVLATVCG